MRENSHPLFKFCYRDYFSLHGTESIGLAADALGVMVFAIAT
jgi:hypothetical protein